MQHRRAIQMKSGKSTWVIIRIFTKNACKKIFKDKEYLDLMKDFVYLFLILILLTACSKTQSPEKQVLEQSNVQEPLSIDRATSAQSAFVAIKDFKYAPAEIKVAKGTTITWMQQDSAPHTVTGDEFDSGTLSKGKTYSRTFDEVGTYEYICTIHPSMKGKVIVS